jgi:hypothetical protein
VRYQKRIEATSNIGTTVAPLVFGDGPLAAGALKVLQGSGQVEKASATDALPLLLLLALAVLAARRRT